MIETPESIGWGTIVTLFLALATSLLGFGASTQRNKRTAEDVDDLRREAEKNQDTASSQIGEVRKIAEGTIRDLNLYQREVERDYPRKAELGQMEGRLGAKVDDMKKDVFQKVDEIKADFSKRSIEHTIKNAVTSALAHHTLTAKGKVNE